MGGDSERTPPSGGNVWLVGMPGSGKSTVGEALAGLLGAEFVEADREIEARTGRRVSDLFAEEGEVGFRRLESELIEDLAAGGGRVVACGGGAVLDPTNREAMRRSGVVVLLEASLEALAARVASGEPRPLVRGPSDLARLLAEREPAYRAAADLRIDASGPSSEVAARIAEALS